MPGGAELALKVRGSLLQVKEPLTAFGFGEGLVSRAQLLCPEWGGSHLISYQKLQVRKSGHLLETCGCHPVPPNQIWTPQQKGAEDVQKSLQGRGEAGGPLKSLPRPSGLAQAPHTSNLVPGAPWPVLGFLSSCLIG